MTQENKFEMGRLNATPGAVELINSLKEDPEEAGLGVVGLKFLSRHMSGDWGDLTDDDKKLNDQDLDAGGRLHSAYHTEKGKLWIITEWDRSSTTLLLPAEY